MPTNKKKKSTRKGGGPSSRALLAAPGQRGALAPPPATNLTFDFKHGCRHGAPDYHVDFTDRLNVLLNYETARKDAAQLEGDQRVINKYSIQPLGLFDDFDTQFWMNQPENFQYLDEKMVQQIFAIATEALLGGNESISWVRHYFNLAARFQVQLNHPEKSHDEQAQLITKTLYEARTDRGFQLQLAKIIPCSCLDEKKAAAKSAPRTRRCAYCGREGRQDEILKCSRCNFADYCSKECQRQHWTVHKGRQCDMLRAGTANKSKN